MAMSMGGPRAAGPPKLELLLSNPEDGAPWFKRYLRRERRERREDADKLTVPSGPPVPGRGAGRGRRHSHGGRPARATGWLIDGLIRGGGLPP